MAGGAGHLYPPKDDDLADPRGYGQTRGLAGVPETPDVVNRLVPTQGRAGAAVLDADDVRGEVDQRPLEDAAAAIAPNAASRRASRLSYNA